VKKILIAGPDIGMEFGWMLMRWQAKIRHMSYNYDDTYVITTHDRMFVYEDFAKLCVEIPNKYQANMWRPEGCEVTYVQPNKKFCVQDGQEEFIRFGDKQEGISCVAIHMRKKQDGREWGEGKWKEFVEELKKKTKLPIVPIGLRHLIYDLTDYWEEEGWESFARLYFKSQDILANSVLCIGPSSGAMHLASLCGCEHLVWTDNKKWNLGFKKGTNRERYETAWNPLNTPVTVIDSHGWNPPVDVILNETRRILKRKGCLK
jgi:hypothetical protein